MKEIYEYRNLQNARALWYHDHAIGITRLNIYAGLAGFYLIRDPNERSLNLPGGKFEIPLLLQDRSFNEDGSLFYPEQSSKHPTEFTPSIISSFLGIPLLLMGRSGPFLKWSQENIDFAC